MPTKKQQIAALPAGWQQRFKASSIKVGFLLTLSRSMLEMLCAIADDCDWDRATFGDLHYPDNWIATESSLEKRGLVERKDGEEREATRRHNDKQFKDEKRHEERDFRHYCKLTPAGEAVIALLKVSGLFIQQDTAIRRRHAS